MSSCFCLLKKIKEDKIPGRIFTLLIFFSQEFFLRFEASSYGQKNPVSSFFPHCFVTLAQVVTSFKEISHFEIYFRFFFSCCSDVFMAKVRYKRKQRSKLTTVNTCPINRLCHAESKKAGQLLFS